MSSRGASQVASVRGRPFVRGNGGRKPGSKNKKSLVAAALLEGEQEELVRKAVELAKRGDRQVLIFLLGRLLPRDRLVALDLPPIVPGADVVEAFACIMRAVAEAAISPAEGAQLAAVMNSFCNAVAKKPPSRELTPSLADHLQLPESE
jgi:hypothetical protein